MPKKCVWECDKKGAILCTIFENLKQSLFRGAGWLGLLSALCGPTATSTPFRVLISYRFVRPCREEGGEDCDRSHFPHLHNYDPLPHILSKIGKGFAPTEEPCSVANSISLFIWCWRMVRTPSSSSNIYGTNNQFLDLQGGFGISTFLSIFLISQY